MRPIVNVLNDKLAVGAAMFLCALTIGNAQESPRRFSHPDRIRYDSQCLTIDGKDMVIYSGAFHYFRCPRELWRDRFQKIKAAGFNTVETYVAWNWSEPEMPGSLADFSKVKLDDLDEWLKMAENYGFYVIVRPGPYICAEWDSGGFPQWLMAKIPQGYAGQWLRSDNSSFLAWSKHWYDAVCPVIAKHQITHKGKGKPGVILVQLENEYDFEKFPDQVKINHIKALAHSARENGIDVPFITCWTHQVRGSSDPVLRQIFDCCNFYPRWKIDEELDSKIAKLRAEQPDAPLGTTELQGGWFSNVGGKLSEDQDGLTGPQINYLTLVALADGDTLMNYYMLFGGSNFGDTGAKGITTTYDYAAPIREWGGVDDRYRRVWAIGHMLAEHGAKLARADKVDCNVKVEDGKGKPVKDVAVVMRLAKNGDRYFFVRTPQRTHAIQGVAHVAPKMVGGKETVFNFNLQPFGAKVFYLPAGVVDPDKGEWLPKTPPDFVRPTNLPPKVEITSARYQSDPGPSHWTRIMVPQNLAQLGVYDSDFVYYKTTMNDSLKTNLLVKFPEKDAVLATANGKPAVKIATAFDSTKFLMSQGFNNVVFLYENSGHPNFGPAIEQSSGIISAQLIEPPKISSVLNSWRMKEVSSTEAGPEVGRAYIDDDWLQLPANKLQTNSLAAGHTAVYRTTINLTLDDFGNGVKLNLIFDCIDDLGWVYVNGKLIGKTTDWSHGYTFDTTGELEPGLNVVAVIVHNNEASGGIGGVVLGPQPETRTVRMEAFGRPTGLEEQWWKRSTRDRDWSPVSIGPNSAEPASTMLGWYRMNFRLPSTKSHVWVPWRLHLNANGNGFLYLNGHALGRYWEAGPQHDFFLPECWLESENEVTLSLRPGDKGASIESASVEPYAEFAEKR
jgi:hypothetical protein